MCGAAGSDRRAARRAGSRRGRCAAILGCLLSGLCRGGGDSAVSPRRAGHGPRRPSDSLEPLGQDKGGLGAAAAVWREGLERGEEWRRETGSFPMSPFLADSLVNQNWGQADTGSKPRTTALGNGQKPEAVLRLPVHHRPPLTPSLPDCTWPLAPGSSSPARSRCAGRGRGSCFCPGCSTPPPWGWGKARFRSLLGNRGEKWVRGRGRDADQFVPDRRRLPLSMGRELWGSAMGKPVPRPQHLAEPPGSPWRGWSGGGGGKKESAPSVQLMAAIVSRGRIWLSRWFPRPCTARTDLPLPAGRSCPPWHSSPSPLGDLQESPRLCVRVWGQTILSVGNNVDKAAN